MAVTTTKTNKPLNPRGNDQSPKGYNRAEIYSGKALDFDGVNDEVNGSVSIFNGLTALSVVSIIKIDNTNSRVIIDERDSSPDGVVFYKDTKLKFAINNNAVSSNTTLETGVYYHICATWDGSTISLFLNGQLENTITYSGSISTTANYKIGNANPFASRFDGQIIGMRVFNTALTAAQVADLYNNPEKIVPTGVADSALKLWLPMQEGAGTTCYNGAPDALGSNVVTNGTFDDNLDDWTTNDQSNGSITYDNGTALITSNGGSGYPSIHQRVSTTVGERYIVKANFSNNTTGAWFWKHDDDSGLGGTNRVKFFDNDTSSSIDAIFEFTATSTLSTIAAFAEQADAGSFNLDNVEVLPMSNIGTISGATWTHGIGAPVSQTAVINWNKHILAGVGQTQNEILFPEGLTAGRDLLGNLFENVRKQGALNLDGNSWAEVHDNASLDMTTTATMEAWVNCDDLVAAYQIIMVKSSATYWTGNYGRYTLRANQNSVNWWFDDYTANSKTHSISLSGYNHLVVTKDGTTEKLYINGALVSTKTGAATFTASPYSLVIGAQSSYAENWDNQLAQPRIYNRALTAEEVERNYNAGKNIYK